MLPAQFEEPAGFKWGDFTNSKGAKIRYGSLPAAGEPKGTMVIVPGFRESIEKYFEVIREMTGKGFNVWVMDWRGQGGSERFIKENQQKMSSEGYDEQIDTLHQFAEKIVEKLDGPMVLCAHSMGAHIGMRYLKEHEGVFDSALLTSPMLEINTGTLPHPLARQVAKFAKAGGYLSKYVPGGGDWSVAKHAFKNNPATSDPDRFAAAQELYKNKPDLRMGDPTYGWIYHTFESIDILKDEEYLKSIKTPVLMQISGTDAIVDKSASERAAGLMPDCRCVDMPKAKHEIWMETDGLRNQWIAEVDSFLEERLKKHAPSPKKSQKNNTPHPPKPG